jgi:imidazolonepropionase-like amidohydrolase
LRHLLCFRVSKAEAISKITREPAEIIGVQDNIGQVKPGSKASMVIWNDDLFSLTSHLILVIAEGKVVYKE